LLDVPHTWNKTTNLAWETWMGHCKGKEEGMTCPYTIGVLAFNLKTWRNSEVVDQNGM
jgi:hypothetical protein